MTMKGLEMPENLTTNDFDELVNVHYKFLEENFGFSVHKRSDWTYVVESHDTRIHIYLEHFAILVVEIEPIGEAAKQLLRKNLLPSIIDIVPISNYYDPELHYKAAMREEKRFEHNIPVEIARRAELLKKYFFKMLQGDFSEWGEISRRFS